MDPYASRETLDHSIMYIFAVALEDGAWHHVKSYTPQRARRKSTVKLWQKIVTRENKKWTKKYHNKDPKTHLRHLVAELLTAYRGADAEHRLQLQSTTALSLEQQHELAETQRAIVKIFADTIESIAPDYLQGMPQYQRPITMSLFGMLNWFYLWYQPGGGMTRIEYADLATEILLGGLDRLRCNKQQINLKRTKVTLETKIPL